MRKQSTKPSPKSGLPKPDGLFLDNFSALEEYLKYAPHLVKNIEVRERHLGRLEKLLATFKISKPLKVMDEKGGHEDSAGLRAFVNFRHLSEDDLIAACSKSKDHIVLALDHISDPRNFGAIVRSAAFFGVKKLIVAEKRQAPVTSAALNTAQGAFCLVDIFQVVNLNRSLSQLKEQGFWIVGADMQGEAIKDVAGFYDHTVLVMGSEGEGMAQKVRENCDRIVAIEGAAERVESLNVSVAAGILLHNFCNAPRP